MPEEAYSSLPSGITEIDQVISDQVDNDSIGPTSLGGVLRRILRTVFDVSASAIEPCNTCWFVGEGNPSGEVGKEGDHYLDLLTGKVFEFVGVGEVSITDIPDIDVEIITEGDLEDFYTGWVDTGYTVRGERGLTGATGAAGTAGAAGASVDIRVQGTELQTKLTNEADLAYSAVFDFSTIDPELSVTVDRVLEYKLAGQLPSAAQELFDFSTLAPVLRVDSTDLQWKLAVQALEDYQTIFDLDSITPVLRVSGGQLQYKYANQDDAEYADIGAIAPVSQLVGSQLPIDVTFSNIVPDITPASVSATDQLGAVLKGIDNVLTDARLKMRSVTVDAAMITARTVDFSVPLTSAVSANVVLDGAFIDPSTVSINSSVVMTWVAAGTFDSAVSDGSRVILFSS